MNQLAFVLTAVFFAAEGAATAPAAAPPAAPAAAPAAPSAPTAPAAPAKPAEPTIAETLARIDALHARRDDPKALAEERQLIDTGLAKNGREYGLLWRGARLNVWLADDASLPIEQRSRFGKTAWDLAERAIVVNPGDVAGHYWAGVGMGAYALGIGVVKALSMGIEGKFKEHLTRAGQLSPGYERGGIDQAWGRFYEKLPWPKRDRKKAEIHLRKVLSTWNPNSLRARVFLADTLAHDDQAPEAKRLLEEVAAAKPGRYDAPEERRAKALGAALMPEVLKELD